MYAFQSKKAMIILAKISILTIKRVKLNGILIRSDSLSQILGIIGLLFIFSLAF